MQRWTAADLHGRRRRIAEIRFGLYRRVLIALAIMIIAAVVFRFPTVVGSGAIVPALLTLVWITVAYLRSLRGDPSIAIRDSELLAPIGLVGFGIAAVLGGPPVLPFASVGIVIAYAFTGSPRGRWYAAAFLGALGVGVANEPSDPLLLRLTFMSFGLALLLDPMMRGLNDMTDRLWNVNEELAERHSLLSSELDERTRTVLRLQDGLIATTQRLLRVRHGRSDLMGAHVPDVARVLARAYAELPDTDDALDDAWADDVARAAGLLDVGKLGIPGRVLSHAEPLRGADHAAFIEHCRIGRDVLDRALGASDRDGARYLRFARDMAYGHHERWDGAGFPDGRSGDEVPVEVRIAGLADSLDRWVHGRLDLLALPAGTAFARLTLERGRGFDPVLVDLAMRHRREIEIALGVSREAGA